MTKSQAPMTGRTQDSSSRAVHPSVLRHASGVMRGLLCSPVRAYQLLVSPLLPRTCRFYPSCSEYVIQAITEYGVVRGVRKGLWRLLRCQPFCRGGYDPVIRGGNFKMQSAKCKVQNDAGCPPAFSSPSAVRK
jgi:putative membrane protein insertion efficiency factor